MSIAISLKVHDGVVLAADSASTLLLNTPEGPAGVVTVYNNANKIFNLRKGWPIGCVTFGAGSIGNSSIATLMKDFRREITNGSLKLDPRTYSIEDIARKLVAFLGDEMKRIEPQPTAWPQLGITVSGYSANSSLASEWAIEIKSPTDYSVEKIRPEADCGLRWGGQGEALERLVVGFSPLITQTVMTVATNTENANSLLSVFRQQATAPLIQPAMPIQDAIDLARFLVDASIMFHRFLPGAPTVGGPVEIAAVTKHEGFKWVARKHYWDIEYNRETIES